MMTHEDRQQCLQFFRGGRFVFLFSKQEKCRQRKGQVRSCRVRSGPVGSGRSGRVRSGQVESGCNIVMTMVIGDHWIMHDFLLQSKHKNDYNFFDTPLLDSSLRNDLRNLNDFFNDLLDDR